jgi:hypothetical protein
MIAFLQWKNILMSRDTCLGGVMRVESRMISGEFLQSVPLGYH